MNLVFMSTVQSEGAQSDGMRQARALLISRSGLPARLARAPADCSLQHPLGERATPWLGSGVQCPLPAWGDSCSYAFSSRPQTGYGTGWEQ